MTSPLRSRPLLGEAPALWPLRIHPSLRPGLGAPTNREAVRASPAGGVACTRGLARLRPAARPSPGGRGGGGGGPRWSPARRPSPSLDVRPLRQRERARGRESKGGKKGLERASERPRVWREAKLPDRPLRRPFSASRSPARPDHGAALCRRRQPKSLKRSPTWTCTGPRRPQVERRRGRRPPWGARGGAERGRRAGPPQVSAPFVCARPGRGGAAACSAWRATSPSSPRPPETPLFIVVRHDASLRSAAAATSWAPRPALGAATPSCPPGEPRLASPLLLPGAWTRKRTAGSN
ncbi:translation initiation factor IF-2-like [Elephas maximus indicus]|uniref:translation initiation factor IF-2-like n=1 Tax=Elephas maximus indicus TaxID=99487 RepID=UPI0021169638|nr:translation initiation factor IF-2-like [Elephas maximus indicus]